MACGVFKKCAGGRRWDFTTVPTGRQAPLAETACPPWAEAKMAFLLALIYSRIKSKITQIFKLFNHIHPS